ncbi:MAG: Flp family type IVb pilin [Rickettsiales bacterium]
MNTFKQFLGDESGATAIEYGLIAALISIAAVLVLRGVGTSINKTFSTINTELNK